MSLLCARIVTFAPVYSELWCLTLEGLMSLFLPTLPNPLNSLLHHPSPYVSPFFPDPKSFPYSFIQEVGEPSGPPSRPTLSSLGCYTTPHFYGALLPALSRVAAYIDSNGPHLRNVIWLQVFVLLGLSHAQLPTNSPPLSRVRLPFPSLCSQFRRSPLQQRSSQPHQHRLIWKC